MIENQTLVAKFASYWYDHVYDMYNWGGEFRISVNFVHQQNI